MTTYYVGSGGNNSNAGTSWALRKLTIGGAEAIGLSAGDVVYVGPGTYRESLGPGASGSSGSPITFIGDVTGAHTDGVGGIVRWTGSDDDTTAARQQSLSAGSRHYRTYCGFHFDLGSVRNILLTTCNNWVIEDCVFTGNLSADRIGIHCDGSIDTITIRRCVFQTPGWGIYVSNSGTDATATNFLIENCIFANTAYGLYITDVDGIVVNNCLITGCYRGMYVVSLAASKSVNIYNSIIHGNYRGVEAGSTGMIVEDYNCFGVNSDGSRRNTNVGANSTANIPHMAWPPQLAAHPLGGLLWGWEQAAYSPIRAITGSGTASDDWLGHARPATAAKLSYGPLQYVPLVRDTATTYSGSPASVELSDAGRVQFKVPTDGSAITISVRAYREANYAGTNPQMIIRQPGQSARTTLDSGSASAWNLLTDTFTPAAAPGYVLVELVSNNTATSGSYAAYFDDLQVT